MIGLAIGLVPVLELAPTHAAAETAFHQAIDEFSFTGYAKGTHSLEKKFTIEGKKAAMSPARAGFIVVGPVPRLCLKNVSLTFYDKDKKVSRLYAKNAVINRSRTVDTAWVSGSGISAMAAEYDFTEGIFLCTEDGKVLSCDKLIWRNTALIASGNCVLSADGKTIRGDLIVTDNKLSKYKVQNEDRNEQALFKRRNQK